MGFDPHLPHSASDQGQASSVVAEAAVEYQVGPFQDGTFLVGPFLDWPFLVGPFLAGPFLVAVHLAAPSLVVPFLAVPFHYTAEDPLV